MKKIILIMLVFGLGTMSSAATVNQLIASVGSIAITSYDIKQMRSFQKHIVGKTPSSAEALEELISMAALLVIAEDNPDYYMDEIELRKSINTMTNNPADPNSAGRKKIYEEYSDLYRMTIRADKVRRNMMFVDVHIQADVNKPIPNSEAKKFYNKHKAQFQDSPFPKFDIIIFAVEPSPKWSLSELSEVETKMQELAKDLDKSSDYDMLRKKYSSLRFTPFSGRTGLYTPDILILQKKVPDEILGISMESVLQLGPTSIPISKNKGIYIPQPIPFRSTGKPTYLTMKIMNVVKPTQLTFDEALPKVEEAIKYQRGQAAVTSAIKEKIAEGQVSLIPAGSDYSSVFRKFK